MIQHDLKSFWHPPWPHFGTLLAPIWLPRLPFRYPLLPFGSPLWDPFGSLSIPSGTPLAPRWLPFGFLLVPCGFLFPPFRGSPWNYNAISCHVHRCLLRHVHVHSAVAGPRFCRAIDMLIYVILTIHAGIGPGTIFLVMFTYCTYYTYGTLCMHTIL